MLLYNVTGIVSEVDTEMNCVRLDIEKDENYYDILVPVSEMIASHLDEELALHEGKLKELKLRVKIEFEILDAE